MNAATSSQMLLAFWRQRDREAPWARRLLSILVLLSVGAIVCFAADMRPMLLASCTVLAMTVLWTVIAGDLLQQNHPHAARFVPGHVRRLREVALAVWALTSLACATALWLFVPRTPSFVALLLFSAASLAFMAWAARTWTLWLVASFGPPLFFGAGLDRRLAPLWHALYELWAGQPLSILALCLLALGWAITRLFGNGDAAHRESYACQDRVRRAAKEGPGIGHAGPSAFGKPGEWVGQPFQRAASAWLRHVVTQAQPTRRSVMSRAEVVLHGQQHWLRQVMGILVGLCIAVLSCTVAFSLAGGSMGNWSKGAYGMAIGLASMGFNPGFALPPMLWRTRREQALLRLLPGMPQGQDLNRAVAVMAMRHTFIAWTATSAGLAVLAWAAGDLALLCLAFGALPLSVGWLLHRPALMRPPTAWTAVAPVFAFLLTAWGMYALHQKLDIPLLALAGASLTAAVLLGLWRWHAVMAAPTALPAGRFS